MSCLKVNKITIIFIWFSFILCNSFADIALASSNNWIPVKEFSRYGSISYKTEEFTCNYVTWRIIWEYIPNSQNSNLTSFAVYIYPLQSGSRGRTYVDSIIKYGTEETKGISIIDNYSGTFTLNIIAKETESFKINIEQNVNSIPEFPLLTILPLFLVSTLFVIVIKKKLF